MFQRWSWQNNTMGCYFASLFKSYKNRIHVNFAQIEQKQTSHLVMLNQQISEVEEHNIGVVSFQKTVRGMSISNT